VQANPSVVLFPMHRNLLNIGSLANGLSARILTLQLYGHVSSHLRAKKAGAEIIDEPADRFYGDRRYSTTDPEGHHWYFAQHVRDVSVKEMKREMNKR
jgi:hypothetical protein